jgi:glycosyltransferase involved in cell wall biosynthesis
MLRPRLQTWDLQTLPRVHEFIANSKNVQERIKRIYQRESTVIYPPTDVDFYAAPSSNLRPDEGFYLIVSALAPYKKVEIALEAFRRMNKRLVIIGEGQESQSLKRLAGPQTTFLGWLSNDELRSYYQTARALIFPGEEDFGIVPVEAMAAGCPIIALRRGGALETVVENKTGLFFDEATPKHLAEAVARFEQIPFNSSVIREHARIFNRARCEDAFRSYFIEYKSEMS